MTDHTSPLDNLLHSTSARTLQYERQLKELEVSLPASTPTLSHPCIIIVEALRTPEQLENNRYLSQTGPRQHPSEIGLTSPSAMALFTEISAKYPPDGPGH